MLKAMEIIVACDAVGNIGRDGSIPWRIPDDVKHFRDLTTAKGITTQQNVVIMGRRTWESLGRRPLPDRLNIVVSSLGTLDLPNGVLKASSLSHARTLVNTAYAKVFIIGGERLYIEALLDPHSMCVHLTMIHHEFEGCDATFPLDVCMNRFVASESSGTHKCPTSFLEYTFYTLVRSPRIESCLKLGESPHD
jgi:dihydrofolate reductase